MNQNSQKDISRRKQLWAGRMLIGIVTAALLGSAISKIAGAAAMVGGLTHAGIPRGAIVPIAALELSCLTIYLVPRTRLLGMLLLTGYFGGAVVTDIIGQKSFLPPLVIGFFVWAGAYLQNPLLQRMLRVAANGESLAAASQVASTMARSR